MAKDYSEMSIAELEQLRDELENRIENDDNLSMGDYFADNDELDEVEDALQEAYDREFDEELEEEDLGD